MTRPESMDRFPYFHAGLSKWNWACQIMGLIEQHPRRWLDKSTDEPIVRDFPNSLDTQYMFTGHVTREMHCVWMATLSQMLVGRKAAA